MSQTRADVKELSGLLETIVPKRSPKNLGEVADLITEIRFRYGAARFDEADLMGTATFLFRLYLRSLAMRYRVSLQPFNNPSAELSDLVDFLLGSAVDKERISGEPNKKCPLRLQIEEAQKFFLPKRLAERFLIDPKEAKEMDILRTRYNN